MAVGAGGYSFAKPKKEGPSLGGFIENLFEGGRDFATGILPGIVNMGATIGGDALHAISGGTIGNEFHSDDLLKGIASYYKDDSILGALVQGHIGDAAHRLYENPFDAAMDVWAAASLGAGAGVKAGLVKPGGGKLKLADPNTGIEYAKRLSPNPISARVQESLALKQNAKAAADPTSSAAGRITRKAWRDAFKKDQRERDAVAGEYLGVTRALKEELGDIGDLAATIKGSGMTPVQYRDGLVRVLSGDQKAFFEKEIDRARPVLGAKTVEEAHAAIDAEIKKLVRGKRGRAIKSIQQVLTGAYGPQNVRGYRPQFGSMEHYDNLSGDRVARERAPKANSHKEAKAAVDAWIEDLAHGREPGTRRNVPDDFATDVDGARATFEAAGFTDEDFGKLRDYLTLRDEIAAPEDLERLRVQAEDHMEKVNRYDLTDDRRTALQQRVNLLDAELPQLGQLLEHPALNHWYDKAQQLSRAVEDEYAANSEHLRHKANEGDEAGLEANREFIKQGRTREYRLLYPDQEVPAEVAQTAIYRPHTLDGQRPNISGMKKGNATANSSKKSTGKLFLSGLDDPDPMQLFNAFVEQREAGLHNRIRSELAAQIQPMTRAQFEQRRAGGEKLVNIGHDPRMIKVYKQYAKTLGKMRDMAPEGVRGEFDDLRVEIDEARRALEQGGKLKHDQVLAVPEVVWDSMRKEPGHAKTALGEFISKGTDYWRAAVLSYRFPQWMLNNGVGQGILLGVGAGPGQAAKALHKTLAGPEGKALRQAIDDVAPEVTSTGTADVFRSTQRVADGEATSMLGKAGEKILGFSDRVGGWNSRFADDPYRRARFFAAATPKLEELKKAGKAKTDAEALRIASKDIDWLDDVTEETVGDMIDFKDLSPFERKYLRGALPFYSWIKGSAKVSGRHLRDKPGTMESIGVTGDVTLDQLEERYGELPSFIRGAIPLPGFLQNEDGSRILSTASMNPFVSPADTASALGQFIPGVGLPEAYAGESIIAQMNPFLKAPLAAATGTDPFYGAKLAGQKFLGVGPEMQNRGDFALHQFLNIPQIAYLVKATQQGQQPRSMYQQQWWQPHLQMFGGLPVKDLRLAQAHARALKEKQNAGMVNKS